MLQAAVFEKKYNIVVEASGLLDNFGEEMQLTKTGNNAKECPGSSAVDILSLQNYRFFYHHPHRHVIQKIYEKLAEGHSRLTGCSGVHAMMMWNKQLNLY